MNINRRESLLLIAILTIMLAGLSLWLGEPALLQWKEAGSKRSILLREKEAAQRLLEKDKEWHTKLDALQGTLSRYKAAEQVNSDLLKQVKKMADENKLSLTRTETQKEKSEGHLSEVAIECNWDGTLDALIHFLYAVQVRGAMMDLRQITVTPAQGVPGRLKGNFTVHLAFIREGGKPLVSPAKTGVKKTPKGG